MQDGILVTALILQRDGKTSHPREMYIERFGELADTGLPIVFFCDWQLIPGLKKWPNVTVVPSSFSSLPLHRFLHEKHVSLPKHRNEKKDTYDYLVIQNSKVHFAMCALATFPEAQRVTWVDAGITYLFKEPGTVEQLRKFCGPTEEVPVAALEIPGCSGWGNVERRVHDVSWFFCGSLFSGTRRIMARWNRATMTTLVNLLPALTWEVNVWAEAYKKMPTPTIRRYIADHDDTLVTNY